MEKYENDSGSSKRWKLACAVFLAVAGFFLVTEHTAHVFGVLPYLLLLLCPVMHLFMHGGHGDHRAEGKAHDRT